MSDESPPPQLRLRPRKRDDEPVPAANPASVAPAVEAPLPAVVPSAEPVVVAPPTPPQVGGTPDVAATSPTEAPARFRLKPKLVSDAEVKAPVESAAPPAVVPAPVVELPPSAPSVDATGIPRLRLKMVESGAAPVMPVPPMLAPEVPMPRVPPPAFAPLPPPVPPSLSPPVSAPIPPPLPEISTPPPMAVALPPVEGGSPADVVTPLPSLALRPVSAVPPVPVPPLPTFIRPTLKVAPKKKVTPVVVLIALVGALAAVGYFVFIREQSPAPVVANHPAVSAPASTPAAAVPPAGAPAVQTPKVSQIPPLPPPPPPPSATATKSTQSVASAAAAAAFRAWINDVRITGVRSGAAPRAMINGRLVRPGDIVDASAGIVFDGLDEERKQVVFRDRTGAFATKSY